MEQLERSLRRGADARVAHRGCGYGHGRVRHVRCGCRGRRGRCLAHPDDGAAATDGGVSLARGSCGGVCRQRGVLQPGILSYRDGSGGDPVVQPDRNVFGCGDWGGDFYGVDHRVRQASGIDFRQACDL